MINERTVRDSHGWRREKRRRCNLIRLIRPIIDHPMVFRARLFGDEDAAHHLAKVLRALWFHRWRANVVNQELIAEDARWATSERGGFERIPGEVGADDERRCFALGECPGTDEDPVGGRAVRRHIYNGCG